LIYKATVCTTSV